MIDIKISYKWKNFGNYSRVLIKYLIFIYAENAQQNTVKLSGNLNFKMNTNIVREEMR